MNGLGIQPIEKEQSRIWTAPPPTPTKAPVKDYPNNAGKPANQLSLF